MKKLISIFVFIFMISGIFAQSAEYKNYINKAKDFESKKHLIAALDAYYDAMGSSDEVSLKTDAINGFLKLTDSIRSGSLGAAIYDDATYYAEWKNLLTDAGEFAKIICKYEFTLGPLSLMNVEDSDKNPDCMAFITKNISSRYKKAYKSEWADLPFPDDLTTLFISENANNYELKFNVVDKNGQELISPKSLHLNDEGKIVFENISDQVKAQLESRNAFLNPLEIKLKSEKTEIKLPLEKTSFYCWDKSYSALSTSFSETMAVVHLRNYNFSELSDFYIGKTEVTQDLYEAVMGYNPSKFKGSNLPVEKISWFDAIYFCNECSRLDNLTPVYSIDGETDVSKWNYTPHKGKSILGEVSQNLNADGYRLPTSGEWEFASMGGKKYNYSGSDILQEVGWYFSNSNNKTHPVAAKNPNTYDLYDMSGNVWEWVWEAHDVKLNLRCCRGGSWYNHADNSKIQSRYYKNDNRRDDNLGLRLLRSKS